VPPDWQPHDELDYLSVPNPWRFSDPTPPAPDASDQDKASYVQALEVHFSTMIECYTRNKFWGESLWIEVLEDFSPHGIFHHYPIYVVAGLRDFLLNNGVFCEKRPRFSRRQALADCLLQERCVELDAGGDYDPEEPSVRSADDVQEDRVPENRLVEVDLPHPKSPIRPEAPPPIDTGNNSERHLNIGNVTVEEASTRKKGRQPQSSALNDQGEDEYERSNSGTLIKMYQNRKRFLGHYNENLEARIREYEVLCQSCRVSKKGKRNMIVIMLQDDSLEYYINNLSTLEILEDVFDGLRSWFTSSEQRQRVLIEWQSATFDQFLRSYPQESEARCFQRMCARLSGTQRQLDKAYHSDTLLRDRIVQTMNGRKDVMQALRAYPPETAHIAQQRIASFLSSSSRAAMDSNIMPATAYMVDRRFSFASRPARKSPQRQTRTMKCWVCQGPHRARTRHTQDEIRSALRAKTNLTEVEVDDEDLRFAFAVRAEDEQIAVLEEESEEEEGNASAHFTNSFCSETNKEIASFWADQAFCHAIRGT
jgi:hypothetical protein